VRLAGPHYAIVLHPVTATAETVNAPIVNVSVLAQPAPTATATCASRRRTPRTTSRSPILPSPPASCAACARYERAPHFREGFALELEDGMAEQLAAYLPRIERVRRVAANRVQEAVQTTLKRAPWLHERSVIADVVANAVLDGHAPAHALARTVGAGFADFRFLFSVTEGDDPHYAELGAALRAPEVITLLDAARGESA
jgi:hypothetical protein